MQEWVSVYEEQAKAREQVDRMIRQAIDQDQTGLPPVAALFPPLNADEYPGEYPAVGGP